MHCLLKFIALACCVIAAAAKCTVSKYKQGPQDWLRCSGGNITEVQSQLRPNVVAVSVSQAVIPSIPDRAFIQSATTLEILSLHDCGISVIANQAFGGLTLLKKLSLPYNNITKLQDSWFYDLKALEQLDLSFNKISVLEPSIYFQFQKLQRLELNDNLLTCIPKQYMENMHQLKNIRIQENPLTYFCRAQLTDWLKHHQISYATNDDNYIWLDGILWECLYTVQPTAGGITSEMERKMNICVVSNMFNQLNTVLGAPALGENAVENSTRDCSTFRQSLTTCLRNQNVTTNGGMLMNVLALTQDVAKIGVA